MPESMNWIAVALSIVTMVGVAIDKIVSSRTAKYNREADNAAARDKMEFDVKEKQFDAEVISRKNRIDVLETKVEDCEKKHKECEDNHRLSVTEQEQMKAQQEETKRRLDAIEMLHRTTNTPNTLNTSIVVP